MGIDPEFGSVDEHDRVLEEDGRSQGGYHGSQTVGSPQGFVGDPFQDDSDDGHQAHDHEGQDQDTDDRTEGLGQSHGRKQGESQIGTDGEQVPVGEVDQLHDPVDHGVPKGDEGVNSPHSQSVGQLLEKKLHKRFSRTRMTLPGSQEPA